MTHRWIAAGFALMMLFAAPLDAADYDLAKVEGIDAFVGSEAARALLAKNGFVVTDRQFRQIFSAYIGGRLPAFITTDSAWHTYHVLLEDGVCALEAIQADRLREFSRKLMEAARARGMNELADFAATGLALQDAEFAKTLPQGQAARVESLRGGSGPAAMPIGLPLSPERFRANSFYTRSPALSGYFAARQRYGAVVFRLKDDRETMLALRLATLIESNAELNEIWARLSEPYDKLLATPDDGDVRLYAAIGRQFPAGDLGAIRKAIDAKLPAPRVNDQLLEPAEYADFPANTKGFRLLPPRRLPSAVCFQSTTDPVIPGRAFPSGLDFLVAVAGKMPLPRAGQPGRWYPGRMGDLLPFAVPGVGHIRRLLAGRW